MNGAGAFKSTDGGQTWDPVNTGLTYSSISCLAGDPSRATEVLAGTYDGGVYKTTDGGVTWNAVNTGLTGKDVYALAVDPSNPQTVYAGTDARISKSTDGGVSWSKSGLAFSFGHLARSTSSALGWHLPRWPGPGSLEAAPKDLRNSEKK
ncbi:MAG: hypothetical protein AB1714_01905 [Acidobacteriota bacterium]